MENQTKYGKRAETTTQLISKFGKLPPQATDLEEVVLGALLLDREAFEKIVDIVVSESFYRDEHKLIFEAISSLYSKSSPIDIRIVTNQLRSTGKLEFVGGAHYISELTSHVASSANIEYHARIIAQKYLLRKLIQVSSYVMERAYDETVDVFDLIEETQSSFGTISETVVADNCERIDVTAMQAMKEIEEAGLSDNGVTGVPTGFSEIDKLSHGLGKSDLIYLAARPGMGKTSYMLQLARNAAVDYAKKVGILSLEQSKIQLVKRLLSNESDINHSKFLSGEMHEHDWEALNRKTAKMLKSNIYIDDSPGMNLFHICIKARRMVKKFGIEELFIDYLQLISGDGKKGQNREQELSTISRTLKQLAKELNIPIMPLAQLSRQVEQREGKIPQLSDLRESGSLEQDADQVIFIYRPEYYGFTEDEEGRPTAGIAKIIFAKNRHGKTDTALLGWDGAHYRFHDLNAPEPQFKKLQPNYTEPGEYTDDQPF